MSHTSSPAAPHKAAPPLLISHGDRHKNGGPRHAPPRPAVRRPAAAARAVWALALLALAAYSLAALAGHAYPHCAQRHHGFGDRAQCLADAARGAAPSARDLAAAMDRTHLDLPNDEFLAESDDSTAGNHTYVFRRAAAACDVPVCSTLATDIMRRGGSAADAAVTLALCLGSVNSFSSGIGGGGFMVVKETQDGAAARAGAEASAHAFNFRERAPAAAHKHMFGGDPLSSKVGGLAVGVPGEVAGLYEAFRRYTSGKLTWAQLIEPVIELNLRGFAVGEPLAAALRIVEPVFVQSPEQWGWLLTRAPLPGRPGDDAATDQEAPLRAKRQGETVVRPNLARTLQLLARNGSAAVFYDPQGPVVPHLVRTIAAAGGVMTAADFANYSVEVTAPIVSELDLGDGRMRRVYTTPNPSSGPILQLGLNVMERLLRARRGSDTQEDWRDFGGVATQRLVETMKWMAASRSQLGDPVGFDNSATIARIRSKSFAAAVAANVSDTATHPWQYYAPAYENVDPAGTTHFSILDPHGMAVSMTTTVNLFFGALVADPATGIVLNNEMDDFSVPGRDNAFELAPSIYNYVAPFKRPLSSCVPTIITLQDNGDERVELAIGAAGGSRILTSVFQAIVRTLMYRTPLGYAVQAPRVHHQLLPHHAELEYGAPAHAAAALKARGHDVQYARPASVANGIYSDVLGGTGITAVSDWWRKRGKPDGI